MERVRFLSKSSLKLNVPNYGRLEPFVMPLLKTRFSQRDAYIYAILFLCNIIKKKSFSLADCG